MSNQDIIVIGTSAGGIDALKVIASGLPQGLKAAVFVVMHISADSPGILAEILNRAGPLPALKATNQDPIQLGHIYVAPPDRHLLLEENYIRLTAGPKENRFRPAIDPLFRSAAEVYGPRVIGVILTGGLDDGTAGLWTIKQQGGTAVVQDPKDALYPSMPWNALQHVAVDYCLPVKEIAPLLAHLVNAPAKESAPSVSEEVRIEVNIAKEDNALEAGVMKLGAPSNFSCPECHGVLLQIKEGDRVRFRCHTGHAYSLESLLGEITERIEESLWDTIRSVEESVLLLRQMADQLSQHNHTAAAAILRQKAQEAQQRSNLVRQAVMSHETLSGDEYEQQEVS